MWAPFVLQQYTLTHLDFSSKFWCSKHLSRKILHLISGRYYKINNKKPQGLQGVKCKGVWDRSTIFFPFQQNAKTTAPPRNMAKNKTDLAVLSLSSPKLLLNHFQKWFSALLCFTRGNNPILTVRWPFSRVTEYIFSSTYCLFKKRWLHSHV